MSAAIATDVLVVGLGPAGAAAAAAAAAGGATTLGIDRKRQPGVPVQCAELVPALLGLEQPLSACAASRQQHVATMTTFVDAESAHETEHFPGHIIDRAIFDTRLVDHARDLGASCAFGVGLAHFGSDGRACLTNGRIVEARVVVGADGPMSRVGKAVGLCNEHLVETRQITVGLLAPQTSTDIYLSAELAGGYGWLFPKGGEANLGLGVASPWRRMLKPLLEKLHHDLLQAGKVGPTARRLTGGAIPVGGMLHPYAELGDVLVLLAGDAAGLTNAITGAGINAACVSGRLAGEHAIRILDGLGKADAYAEDLAERFEASLARAATRRRELMATYRSTGPSRSDLRRSWIAFPQYWAA